MVKRFNSIVLFTLITLMIGCSEPNSKVVTVKEIGPALEEIISIFSTDTTINGHKTLINNRINSKGTDLNQVIELKYKDQNNVLATISNEYFFQGQKSFTNDISRTIHIEKNSNSSNVDYTNNFFNFNIEQSDQIMIINFSSDFLILPESRVINFTKEEALLYLHIKKNIEILQSDLNNIITQLPKNNLNKFLNFVINNPEVSLNKFSNKELVDIYLYLSLFSEEKIDFSSAIYMKNILNTLLKLYYQIESPLIND